MKSYRHLFLGWLLLLPWSCFAQNQDWREITAEERAFKAVPDDPGAPAVQLYYADYRDDDHKSQFIYKRIKILSDAGKKYADVEIPIFPLFHFIDVKARTIHPDGSVAEFTGKPFEKLIVKTHDVKFTAQTFTMPDVTVGSIIEYKYRYEWGSYTFDTSWTVQHDLYTVKEEFSFRGYSGPLKTKSSSSGADTRLSYVVYGKIPPPAQTNKGVIELTMENVPAFKEEDYAPPEGELKPVVRFFYGGIEISSPENFWKIYGREWFEASESFIGRHDSIRRAAEKAIGGETDPEKKLRKLYALAQQTRNLSFERHRTKQEDKKEELKHNENAGDVLDRGYGTHNDVARLFVALARVAGFDAQIVRAPDRALYFFKFNYLSSSQLSSELAVVKLNGEDVYLDPGTELCPFGLVRWFHTSDRGLKLDKTGGTFVVIPPAVAEKTPIRRVAKVKLASDGSLAGMIDVELRGNAALERRLAALKEDEAGRRKSLEEQAKEWLPDGAIVTLESSEGWESSEEPLRVRYKIEIGGFGSVVGKRLLVPAALFQTTKQKRAFERSERHFPVYFPFAYQEMDNLILQAPEGYKPEGVPASQDVKLSSTRFATSRTFADNQFVSKRALVVNGIVFPISRYPELKGFFNQVLAADQEQLVLQNSVTSAAQ